MLLRLWLQAASQRAVSPSLDRYARFMGQRELRDQPRLIREAIASASDAELRPALEGTIGDAQSFCWATLRQFERYTVFPERSTPRSYGLVHAEKHMLLGVAQDAVAHVRAVERLLERVGDPRELPPTKRIRDQLREARNLLAVHRDERVLYWRLTGLHTPHVAKTYQRLGLELPEETIDKEIVAYGLEPWKTEEEIEAGYASVGTVGDMLSLRELRVAFEALEADLDELAVRYCA